MMFVWWAVFFFVGAIFPSCAAGARAALGAISILVAYPARWPQAHGPRALITCASGLFVLVTASLTPIDMGTLSGSPGTSAPRAKKFTSPVRIVRDGIQDVIVKGRLNKGTRGLLRALIVADRSDLSIKTRRDWRNTGTAHYLALSGLHLGLIALPLLRLLTLAGARGVLRGMMAVFALSFYAAVAGCPGSLLRALSMLSVMQAYRLAGIRTGLPQSVAAGAFLVCILDPLSLRNTGFLLSFSAAAGVALLGAPVCRSMQHWLAGKKGSRMILPSILALAMSISVQAFMLPLSVRVFGFAPLLGPLMSVILALPVMILLYGGFTYIICGHLCSRVASIPLNMLSALTAGIVSLGAGISRAGLIISDFDVRLYVPGLVLCATAFRCESSGRAVMAIGLALAVLSFHPLITGRDSGVSGPISFPDHGALFFRGNGGVLVIDDGLSTWTAARLAGELRRSGVRSVDLMIILDPRESDDEGMAFLTDDLGTGRVLVSPWRKGQCPGKAVCTAVLTDTILTTGKIGLAVHAPKTLPVRGAAASTDEASLRISPLD